MFELFHAAVQSLLKFTGEYLPVCCPVCGKPPFDGSINMFCKDCLTQFEFIHGRVCPGCGGELTGIFAVCPSCLRERKRPWVRGYSLFRMEGLVRKLILKAKYYEEPDLLKPLGDLAGDMVVREKIPADWIVPVPLHWSRYLERGYNQAELIASRISKKTGIPVISALKRFRRTKQQAKLSREERICNLNDAFCINHSINAEKRAILLIDDVITTGSTLEAAAGVLNAAGASAVYVMTLARR